VRRTWLGVLAAVAAAAVVATLVVVSHHDEQAPKPPVANPSSRFGDDADLMRRLERHKLVKQAK
jgi:uncharacterized membrane protein YgcG